MTTIKRTFKTRRLAANFQGNLYNKYKGVKLVVFPKNETGEGTYVYEVER